MMRILFLGTPEFAIPTLALLIENDYDIAGVVTSVDKPAGRGRKLQFSAVKKFALENNLNLLHPTNLKDKDFLNELKSLNVDLAIVVAFRMMPEVLWSMPKFGTFNLHGSLLPQYRGAAPIQRAVMNGEKVTGVTTFFLKQEIDTGNIIFQEEIKIGPDETSGELHDRMKVIGAQLVLKTVKAIENNNIEVKNQSEFIKPGSELRKAPKIFSDDKILDFTNDVVSLCNQVRGLSPYPAAICEMKNRKEIDLDDVKIIRASYELAEVKTTGKIITDNKTYLKISASNGFLSILELRWPGKKSMRIDEFLRGFSFDEDWIVF